MLENNGLSKHPLLREFIYKFYPFKLTMFDRYLFKEFIKNTIPALFLFVMVYLLSMLLNEIPYFLRQFDETPQLRFVTIEYILEMYANKAPYFAVWGSPIAFLFGVIYTLSNFYKNNEAVSIIGSGVYIFRFVITILIFSFFYSLALIPFTEVFVVPTWDKANEMNDRARFKVKDESQKDFQTYGTGNLFFYISRFDAEKNQMELPIIWKFKDDYIDRGFTFDKLVDSVVKTGNTIVQTVEDVADGWFFKTMDWTKYGDLEKLAENVRQEQIAKLQELEEEKAKEAENKKLTENSLSEQQTPNSDQENAQTAENNKPPESTISEQPEGSSSPIEENKPEESKELIASDGTPQVTSNLPPVMNELMNSLSDNISKTTDKNNITQDIEQTATQAVNDPKIAQNVEQTASQVIEQGKEILKKDTNNISKIPVIENTEKIASAQLNKLDKLQPQKQPINKQLPAQQAVPPPQPQNVVSPQEPVKKPLVTEPSKTETLTKDQELDEKRRTVEKVSPETNLDVWKDIVNSEKSFDNYFEGIDLTASSDAKPMELQPVIQSSKGTKSYDEKFGTRKDFFSFLEVPSDKWEKNHAYDDKKSTRGNSPEQYTKGSNLLFEHKPNEQKVSHKKNKKSSLQDNKENKKPIEASSSEANKKNPDSFNVSDTLEGLLQGQYDSYKERLEDEKNLSQDDTDILKSQLDLFSDKDTEADINKKYSEGAKSFDRRKQNMYSLNQNRRYKKDSEIALSDDDIERINRAKQLTISQKYKSLILNKDDAQKVKTTLLAPEDTPKTKEIEPYTIPERHLSINGIMEENVLLLVHGDKIIVKEIDDINSSTIADGGKNFNDDSLLPQIADEIKEHTNLFNFDQNKFFENRPPPTWLYRYDAQYIKWDASNKHWIGINVDKWTWDEKHLFLNKESYPEIVLNEILETPYHFKAENKNIECMTFEQCYQKIDKIEKAQNNPRPDLIDIMAKKIALQFSTFLIVLIGTTLGQFHSRKAVLLVSFFFAIGIFLVYYILFQAGVSLSKTEFTFLPFWFAPWIGNLVFLLIAIVMIRKAKT